MPNFVKHPRLDVFKSELVKGAQFSQTYEFPTLQRTDFTADKAIPFEKAAKAADHQQWIHFYTHDRNFECLWNNPKQYLAMLQRFSGVITPDFSLYREMPLAMQIWNTYRNRAIAYWLQSNGVDIIPNVRWGDERTYSFAFEGLPPGGSVAISTNGCIRSKPERSYFKKGLAAMIVALKPVTIINYSQTPKDIFGEYREQGITVVPIENYTSAVHAEAARKAAM